MEIVFESEIVIQIKKDEQDIAPASVIIDV